MCAAKKKEVTEKTKKETKSKKEKQ